jgi:hypothetical protein
MAGCDGRWRQRIILLILWLCIAATRAAEAWAGCDFAGEGCVRLRSERVMSSAAQAQVPHASTQQVLTDTDYENMTIQVLLYVSFTQHARQSNTGL